MPSVPSLFVAFACSGGGDTGGDAPSGEEPPAPLQVLVYGPTDLGAEELIGSSEREVTVWGSDQWLAASTEDFARFQMIYVGEQLCGGPDLHGELDALIATRDVWTPAVTGRVKVSGLDLACHIRGWDDRRGGDPTIPPIVFANTISWLLDGGGTSAFFATDWGRGGGRQFAAFGDWEVLEQRWDETVILEPEHPIFAGVSDVGMTHWGAVSHSLFPAWPDSFRPLVLGLADQPVFLVREAVP